MKQVPHLHDNAMYCNYMGSMKAVLAF